MVTNFIIFSIYYSCKIFTFIVLYEAEMTVHLSETITVSDSGEEIPAVILTSSIFQKTAESI